MWWILGAVVAFVAYVIGEIWNICALRVAAALVAVMSLFLVPLAYSWGTVVGHASAYGQALDPTLEFLSAVETRLERQEADLVLSEIRKLRRAGEDYLDTDKRAGTFFFSDMFHATEALRRSSAANELSAAR